MTWIRPRRCADAACVEVRVGETAVQVRATDRPDAVLTFARESWAVFLADLRRLERLR